MDCFLSFQFTPPDGDVIIINYPDKTMIERINFLGGKIPYILYLRASEIYLRENFKNLLEYKKEIANAARIITISEYNKKFLEEKLNIPSSKIHIVHDSIFPEEFKPFRQKEKKGRIISVCRLAEQKGIPFLIEACVLLKKKGIRFEIVLVGEGEEEKLCRELIKKYSLEKEIKLLGSLVQKEVIKEISKSSIFALPCIIAGDGRRDILANVLKEAMAMQKPVITSDICGIEELVENGKSGILVPEKNPAAIADAIEKLLKNPDLRRKMGKEGRKKVEKDFNIKTETDKLGRILGEIKND